MHSHECIFLEEGRDRDKTTVFRVKEIKPHH